MQTPDRSSLLLDAQRMAPRIQQAWPAVARLRLRDAAVRHSRRRATHAADDRDTPYLRVAYELSLEDPRGQLTRRHWFGVKAYSSGGARAAGAGQRLPQLDAVAWKLADDPALPQLGRLLNHQVLRDTWSAHAGSRLDARAVEPQVLRYAPESQLTLRLPGALGAHAPAVHGTAYADERWARAEQGLQLLWPQAQRHADAFAVARPLGACADLRTVWQAEVPGVPLQAELAGAHAPQWLARVARALARLQALPALDAPGAAPGRAPAALLASTLAQAAQLARADASLEPLLDPLCTGLQATVPDDAPLVNVHGDFHMDQMLCHDGRVLLFNLDGLALGHPAHDLADFASHWLTDERFEPELRRTLARQFVETALDWAPQHCEPDALDWHLRALLLRRAHGHYVCHRPGWPKRVRHALQLAGCGMKALTAPCPAAAA